MASRSRSSNLSYSAYNLIILKSKSPFLLLRKSVDGNDSPRDSEHHSDEKLQLAHSVRAVYERSFKQAIMSHG